MYYYTEDDDRSFAAETAAKSKYDEGFKAGYERGRKEALKDLCCPACNASLTPRTITVPAQGSFKKIEYNPPKKIKIFEIIDQ